MRQCVSKTGMGFSDGLEMNGVAAALRVVLLVGRRMSSQSAEVELLVQLEDDGKRRCQ